jgi:cytochrome c oxidase subunit IV
MSAHHGENPQFYYEGDQSKLYSGILGHHGDVKSAESKTQVKLIWKITLYLSIITIVEVFAGLYGRAAGVPNMAIVAFFLILTILKAYLIVSVFMHLGDERRNFIMAVLIPLVLFVWFIIAFLADGSFWLHMNSTVPTR